MTHAEYKKFVKELTELMNKYQVKVVCDVRGLSPTLRMVKKEPEPVNIIPEKCMEILKGRNPKFVADFDFRKLESKIRHYNEEN